jgi:hypothetical protein
MQVNTAEKFKGFLEKVNQLPDGSTLSIETDHVLLPWEILYLLSYNKTHIPHPFSGSEPLFEARQS